MPNHYYIISEVQFFNDKADKNTWNFVANAGIDLNQNCQSKMPTLKEIKFSLTQLGLHIVQQNYSDNFVEIKATKEDNLWIWLLFTDLPNEATPINMFELGRGSNHELAIDFIKALTKTHGNFLFYFDGGKMSLITDNKEKETIMDEMYSS